MSLAFDNREQGREIEENIRLARAVMLICSRGTERRERAEERKKKKDNSPASISIRSHRSRQNGVSNLGERESMSFRRQATYHLAITQDNRCRGLTFRTISPITAFSVREGLLSARERKKGTMPPRRVDATRCGTRYRKASNIQVLP